MIAPELRRTAQNCARIARCVPASASMSDWCDCTDERSVPWRPSQKRTEPAESPVTTERSAKRSTDHTSGGFRACPSSSIRETSVRAASAPPPPTRPPRRTPRGRPPGRARARGRASPATGPRAQTERRAPAAAASYSVAPPSSQPTASVDVPPCSASVTRRRPASRTRGGDSRPRSHSVTSPCNCTRRGAPRVRRRRLAPREAAHRRVDDAGDAKLAVPAVSRQPATPRCRPRAGRRAAHRPAGTRATRPRDRVDEAAAVHGELRGHGLRRVSACPVSERPAAPPRRSRRARASVCGFYICTFIVHSNKGDTQGGRGSAAECGIGATRTPRGGGLRREAGGWISASAAANAAGSGTRVGEVRRPSARPATTTTRVRSGAARANAGGRCA